MLHRLPVSPRRGFHRDGTPEAAGTLIVKEERVNHGHRPEPIGGNTTTMRRAIFYFVGYCHLSLSFSVSFAVSYAFRHGFVSRRADQMTKYSVLAGIQRRRRFRPDR